MIEHPDYADLLSIISRVEATAVAFKGVLFRACSPEYANLRDLLAGEGARKFGGRWNPPGSFPVVYLAQSMEGAIAETVGVAGHYGFDPATRLPMTLVAVDARLDRVLDLTNAAVRKALKVTIADMHRCPWRDQNIAGNEALTQALGRAAHAAGLQGIRVTSSVRRTLLNVNVFPKNLPGTDNLKIRRADRLPPAPGVL